MPLLDEDYLVLSTIHSAKGQEWRSVFVLNCIDGCIPSDLGTGTTEEIEEERRLLYVAMTRAKDDLHLVLPQRCYILNQASPRRPPCLSASGPASSRRRSSTASAPRLWPPVLAAAATRAAGAGHASTSARGCARCGGDGRHWA